MDTDREIGVVEAGQGSGPAILRDDLSQLADQYRESYLASPPWPHVVIDSLFDPAIIAAAELEELEPALGFEIKRRARMVKAQSPVPSGPAAKEILQAQLLGLLLMPATRLVRTLRRLLSMSPAR